MRGNKHATATYTGTPRSDEQAIKKVAGSQHDMRTCGVFVEPGQVKIRIHGMFSRHVICG